LKYATPLYYSCNSDKPNEKLLLHEEFKEPLKGTGYSSNYIRAGRWLLFEELELLLLWPVEEQNICSPLLSIFFHDCDKFQNKQKIQAVSKVQLKCAHTS